METINVTILLIATALVSTTVSIFWTSRPWKTYMLFLLAVASSLGAIYKAYDDEINFRRTEDSLKETSNMLQHLVLSHSKLPKGFEKQLENSISAVGKREGYSWSELLSPKFDWMSENFGYLAGFDSPNNIETHPEYLDFLVVRGYARGYVYISKDLVHEMVLQSLKRESIDELLRKKAFWIWKDTDEFDSRLKQSMIGIVRELYPVAASVAPPDRRFLQDPESVEIEFDVGRHNGMEVIVKAEGCDYVFAYTERDFLERLVDVNAIVRGGRIASHFLERLAQEIGDKERMLVCMGH